VPPSYVSSTSNSITISWFVPQLHSSLHKSTKLYIDDGANGGFTFLTLTDISLTQYTFTGLTSGNTYRFKYSVVSESGESPESPIQSITAATTPSQPTLTVDGAIAGQVTLEYGAPASNGGSVVTSYKVYRSTDAVDFATLVQTQTNP